MPNNLPLEPAALIGREQDLAAVLQLCADPALRLLTLVGPGGVGKTRLALCVAEELLEQFDDGVFLVELAAITDPDLVIPTIADALQLATVPDATPLASLKAHLQAKNVVLLLDNFEQVIPAGRAVAELLAACPTLKLLITSRAAIGLRSEQEYVVAPLAMPQAKQQLSASGLLQYGAVALFVQRASTLEAGFQLTAANADAVVEVCRRVDGLPLAIELVAAHARLLSPQALLARLTHPLRLLTGGAQDAADRHRTMRDTIDWSYRLLGTAEQQLFRRLAVFAGGFALRAAEAIANDAGDLAVAADDPGAVDVLVGLEALLEMSLLRRLEPQADGDGRLAMLETIHEYAREKLHESGEENEFKQRHAAYFLALVEQAAVGLEGEEQASWLDRLEDAHDNVRAALSWTLEADPDADGARLALGLRLGAAQGEFWFMRGHYGEGRRWLSALIAQYNRAAVTPDVAGTELRETLAAALTGAGRLAWEQGEMAEAEAHFRRSLAIRRNLGDKLGIARLLNNLAVLACDGGDGAAGYALFEESLAIRRELGDKRGIARSLTNLAILAHDQGDNATARALSQESVAILREFGDKSGTATALVTIGNMVLAQGDYAAALPLWAESLALSQELGDRNMTAHALSGLGGVYYGQGDYERARAMIEEGLALSQDLGYKYGVARALNELALLAHDSGAPELARSRNAAGHAIWTELGDKRGIADSLHIEGLIDAAQGNDAAARAHYEQALLLRQEVGDPAGVAASLVGLAATLLNRADSTDGERAARLLGAAETLLAAIAEVLRPADSKIYTQATTLARAMIGAGSFNAARQDGRALSLNQAVELATRAAPTAREPAPPRPARRETRLDRGGLTTREYEVTGLVTLGLTNEEIAQRLVLSERTVEMHVSNALHRLGLTTRTQLAAWSIEHGLAPGP